MDNIYNTYVQYLLNGNPGLFDDRNSFFKDEQIIMAGKRLSLDDIEHGMITGVGFGTVEIRARRPYRILDPYHYNTDKLIYIESVEVCAIKDPVPGDGACVFTGKTAIYFGHNEFFDDNRGHVLIKNQPLSVCDKTANALANLDRDDIFISPSTFFYQGGGCC